MSKIAIIFLLLITTNIFSEELRLKCTNFKGYSIEYDNGKIGSFEDGFSGQEIEFILPMPPQIGSPVTVNWTGRNMRNDQAFYIMSSKDGWGSFAQVSSNVLRTFAFFPKDAVMSMTETQTRMMLNSPQIRTFYSNCRVF